MKVLLETATNKILKYPRIDYAPIVGLADGFVVLDVVQQEMPNFDGDTQYLVETETIDLINKQLIKGYRVEQSEPIDPMIAAKERSKKRLDFYYEMLATINAENDLANFDGAQIQACMTLLMPIKQALEVGVVEGSMYMLSQITPTPEYTAERKEKHLQMFQNFLAELG
jgi:hypothetical protein